MERSATNATSERPCDRPCVEAIRSGAEGSRNRREGAMRAQLRIAERFVSVARSRRDESRRGTTTGLRSVQSSRERPAALSEPTSTTTIERSEQRTISDEASAGAPNRPRARPLPGSRHETKRVRMTRARCPKSFVNGLTCPRESRATVGRWTTQSSTTRSAELP